jgi:hypothetical protein
MKKKKSANWLLQKKKQHPKSNEAEKDREHALSQKHSNALTLFFRKAAHNTSESLQK